MAKRRGRGDGTLLERKPGIWRLRVYMGSDPNTGHPVQAERTFHGNRTGALAELRRFVAEVEAGKVTKPRTRGTVAHLLDEWMTWGERTQGWAPLTVRNRRSAIGCHVSPALGAIPLGRLSVYDIDHYYSTLIAGGMQPSSVRSHHLILSASLGQAVAWGWIVTNPAKRASPPRVKGRQPEAPGVAEMRRLIDGCGDDVDLATAVVLAAITGCRRGELCGLQWSDVDWEHAALRVERQRVNLKGGDRTTGLKHGDPRVVALGDLGLRVLSRYREALRARGESLGVKPTDGWLLSHDCGRTPMSTNGLGRQISALGKRTEVPVTTHAFRRFAATQMIGAGVDLRTAANRLGHSVDVLLKHYAAFLPARDMAAARGLEALVLGNAKTPPA